MRPPADLQYDVPLAPRTTLELGGAAECFYEARSQGGLVEALHWAHGAGQPVRFLGGGSNVVVPDEGVRGLVITLAMDALRMEAGGMVSAEAGTDWELFVERCVDAGLAGVECLAGIPGRVGATPIQNVGAYGQEVAETIAEVRALDLETLRPLRLTPLDCGFGYRDSVFKRSPGRVAITDVRFRLVPGGRPALRYAELEKVAAQHSNVSQGQAPPSLRSVACAVVALRRRKSMVLDGADPNRRSAGSFFTNPIVSLEQAEHVVALAVSEGVVARPDAVPRWPAGEGVKLAAGWLIERAGFAKGMREGPVGLSSKHALALVHHGGGTTGALLAFAERIRTGVRERWGIELEREPRLLGVDG